MKASAAILLGAAAMAPLALAAPADADLVERNLLGPQDGLYVEKTNPDGSTEWEYQGRYSPSPAESSSNELTTRASEGANCNGFYLDANDIQNAINGLIGTCGDGRKYSSRISYQYGNAVAFGCNYGSGQTCYAKDLRSMFTSVEQKCGTSGAGWYSKPSWKASYGYTSVSNSYC
ncbi:hypothetical protein F4778DRAFT_752061 [Xylariomycetidae sp. FL2044]|nr:hypothetical protein F4778DRAFT_752061 [Xylariomycetidae sp. FL2044]